MLPSARAFPSLVAPRPYTTATARKPAAFELDFIICRGFSHVYSIAHLDADKAEQQFEIFLGANGADASVTHTKMRVGHLKTLFSCVAIACPQAFLSRSIDGPNTFIEFALQFLRRFSRHSTRQTTGPRAYNKAVARIFDNIAQFIMLHYVLTNRNSTEFSRDARSTLSRASRA